MFGKYSYSYSGIFRNVLFLKLNVLLGMPNWMVTLEEFNKFIGLIIARGVLGQRGLPCFSLWNTSWGCPMFNKTLSRYRLMEIKSFLRFDMKSDRRRHLVEDRLCLASSMWNCFIENSQKSYVPNVYLTVDEQLLSYKARCQFIQYVANEPDKFGLKFWMVVDNERKYLYNGFPYLGKDEIRDTSMSVPSNVVMKLMKPLFKHGYNVSCDNFFTSLDVAARLAKEKGSLVGTIRHNRRELPQAAKAMQQLHDTTPLKTTISSTSAALACYQCKKAKSVMILSTLHPDVAVSSENNPKKKPETVLFYNKTETRLNVVDQMTRKYSVKAASRR